MTVNKFIFDQAARICMPFKLLETCSNDWEALKRMKEWECTMEASEIRQAKREFNKKPFKSEIAFIHWFRKYPDADPDLKKLMNKFLRYITEGCAFDSTIAQINTLKYQYIDEGKYVEEPGQEY
jgi:hypothetical protein